MRAWYTASFVAVLAFTAAACGGSEEDTPSSGSGAVGGNADAGDGSSGTAGSSTGGTGNSGAVGGSGGSGAVDSDGGDGGPTTLCPPDEDFDNISDDVEGRAEGRDTDGDGTPDYLDEDSDGDTIPDRIEADIASTGCGVPLDSDDDGTPNHLDTDSDNNGILDREEIYPDGAAFDATRTGAGYLAGLADTDRDGNPNVYDSDNDGDTLLDSQELVNGQPVDTDGDGLSDHDDFDSDNDLIGDGYETAADFDGDGKPNFRDLDSDGDSIPDSCEAGVGHTLDKPPADSDSDGKFDFVDVDADNDGLKDGQEDSNFNCVVEPGETSRTLFDTDGDGASDLIEVHLGSDPRLKSQTPQSIGKYYFIMPFNQPPQPPQQDVVLKTNLNKGDIAFVVDTTGTMGLAIQNIRENLIGLMRRVRAEVPEAHFGVLAHEDYPIDPYGSTSAGQNLPVRLPDCASAGMTGSTCAAGSRAYLTSLEANTEAAVQALTTANGADEPESNVAALWKAMTNGTLTWPAGGLQNAFSPSGGYGALGFRSEALAILVHITDAPFHNGRHNSSPSTIQNPYSGFSAPTSDEVISAMNARGAKLVGVSLDNGGANRGDGSNNGPYRDMAYIADRTKSLVPPSAFGIGGNPCTSNAQCSLNAVCSNGACFPNKCLSDVGGGAVAPDGPNNTCRLIFSGYKASGQGTSRTIEDGIFALLRGLNLEVRVLAESDTSCSAPFICQCTVGTTTQPIDAVGDFIEYIQVYAPGQVEDPSTPTQYCETLDLADLRDWYDGPEGVVGGPLAPIPDGHAETATEIVPGWRVCFQVKTFTNTLCPQTDNVQLIRAVLRVRARSEGQTQEFDVGEPRDVIFVIPPVAQ